MAGQPLGRGAAIFTAVVVLIVFVLLTIGELWAAKWLGFDVIAHLQVSKSQGGVQFAFEAFGLVAFILVQPVVLVLLLLRMVRDFASAFSASMVSWLK
jgi:hypothetical protein